LTDEARLRAKAVGEAKAEAYCADLSCRSAQYAVAIAPYGPAGYGLPFRCCRAAGGNQDPDGGDVRGG
jgi:hypothetical protein